MYLAPVVANVAKLNPDGVQNLEWAKGVLRDEVASTLRASNLFAAVVTSEAEIKPGTRVLRFEHTIVEYEKGGGGARFFAGLYGAGQPVLKVQGRLTGGGAGQPLFLYEARRSGDSGGVASLRRIPERPGHPARRHQGPGQRPGRLHGPDAQEVAGRGPAVTGP